MSRAFVREDDGWNFCPARQDTCMYADRDGTCFRKVCKFTGELVDAEPAIGRMRTNEISRSPASEIS